MNNMLTATILALSATHVAAGWGGGWGGWKKFNHGWKLPVTRVAGKINCPNGQWGWRHGCRAVPDCPAGQSWRGWNDGCCEETCRPGQSWDYHRSSCCDIPACTTGYSWKGWNHGCSKDDEMSIRKVGAKSGRVVRPKRVVNPVIRRRHREKWWKGGFNNPWGRWSRFTHGWKWPVSRKGKHIISGCPKGTTRWRGGCRAIPNCPAGQCWKSWSKGCRKDTCPAGQSWDFHRNKCCDIPTCAPGQFWKDWNWGCCDNNEKPKRIRVRQKGKRVVRPGRVGRVGKGKWDKGRKSQKIVPIGEAKPTMTVAPTPIVVVNEPLTSIVEPFVTPIQIVDPIVSVDAETIKDIIGHEENVDGDTTENVFTVEEEDETDTGDEDVKEDVTVVGEGDPEEEDTSDEMEMIDEDDMVDDNTLDEIDTQEGEFDVAVENDVDDGNIMDAIVTDDNFVDDSEMGNDEDDEEMDMDHTSEVQVQSINDFDEVEDSLDDDGSIVFFGEADR